ncbi:MAG: hypothetical protein H6573_04700 [Lewinellaceae bacterium]|nr:hypothetical protein [Phaeodactylibacter sp.]MCB0611785.1 hypothetical protein [Phaeodactylibacter sp.]MCB9346798.1 hypothetical protein [Lewinellaceae bacterium]
MIGIKGYLFSIFFLILLALSLISGCRPDDYREIPDVSDIPADISIRRFEQELFNLDTSRMEAGLAGLEEAYPEFAPIFFGQVFRAPLADTSFYAGFITHPSVRHLYDTCQVVFEDMSGIEAELEQAFRFFQYYFPGEAMPTVTTFISEYTIAAFVYGKNDLAVGLDLFLGETYPYRQIEPNNPAFSSYLTRTFNRSHLVSKSIQALIDGVAGAPSGNRLLDIMVHNGKKLYTLDLLLPYAPDSVKLEVTPDQVQWLEDNELEMWAYLLKEELVYSSNWQDIRKLVDYSPNSPGMPPQAPGRTANWIGWQIVKAYMKKHPEASLQQLFALTDAQALLDESRYKPKR